MKRVIVIILLSLSGLISVPLFAQQAMGTSKELAQPAGSSVEISSFDSRIIVSNAPPKSKMEIYSIVGTKIKVIDLKQPSGEYYVGLPKGYYIVRIAETVRKIVIR